jgi:hypothetical protein
MRRSIQAIAVAGCAVALFGGTGCNEDERDIRTVFSDIRRAYLTENYHRVCSNLTTMARREVGELGHLAASGCAADMERNMSATILSPRDRVEPEIREIDVDGARATVLAVLAGTTFGTVHFLKQDGEWKLDQLWGTTAPPPPDLR